MDVGQLTEQKEQGEAFKDGRMKPSFRMEGELWRTGREQEEDTLQYMSPVQIGLKQGPAALPCSSNAFVPIADV